MPSRIDLKIGQAGLILSGLENTTLYSQVIIDIMISLCQHFLLLP